MASYPNTVKTFTPKENITDVVDASHPNTSEDEITAIETELGVNPRISAYRSVTYANVNARLEAVEGDYRLKTDHDSHALLLGLAGDDHPQYLRTDGTRAPTGVASMVAVPVAVQAGDTQGAGTANTFARSDHRHAVATAAPAASAVGDAQAAGSAQTFARSDHRHAREAFGAVVAGVNFGQSAGDGAASTVARSDHAHGTPSLASTNPSTQAMGDAASIGAGTTAARADHKHALPAFGGSVSDETTWGIAPSAGVATTVARSDHTHGTQDPTLMGPSGVLAMWPTDTPPSGWLICNGQAVSRTTYSVLFGIVGTTFGTGDGSTTFNIPDYRGRVPIGAGQGAGLTNRALAATGGFETHTLTQAQMPVHQHTTPSHNHSGSTASGAGPSAHSHRYDHGHGFNDPGHVHNLGNRSPQTVYDGVNGILVSRGDSTSTVVDYNRGSPNGRDLVTYVDIFSATTGSWVSSTGAVSTGNENSTLSHGHSLSMVNNNPTTNNTGSGDPHPIMQPWGPAINFIIKT